MANKKVRASTNRSNDNGEDPSRNFAEFLYPLPNLRDVHPTVEDGKDIATDGDKRSVMLDVLSRLESITRLHRFHLLVCSNIVHFSNR